MMADALGLREDDVQGRWIVQTAQGSAAWEIIVEPDPVDQLLVVITAYPVEYP